MNLNNLGLILTISGIVVSIFFGGGIYIYYINKRRNKQLINNAFHDMCRHFWRNRVILESLRILMDAKENENKRPSELHLSKLKGLHFDNSVLFNINTFGSINKYSNFHELQLKIRNFHTEADVAVSHLSSNYYNQELIKKYIDALIWKQGYLIEEIGRTYEIIFPKKSFGRIISYMIERRYSDPGKDEGIFELHKDKLIEDVNIELKKTGYVETPIELAAKSDDKFFFVPIPNNSNYREYEKE